MAPKQALGGSVQGEAMPVEAAVGHPLLGRSQRPLRSSDCHLQPAACARPEGPALAPDCPGLGCTGCGRILFQLLSQGSQMAHGGGWGMAPLLTSVPGRGERAPLSLQKYP